MHWTDSAPCSPSSWQTACHNWGLDTTTSCSQLSLATWGPQLPGRKAPGWPTRPLHRDQVVGLPELHLGGGPGCIGVLPLVPPVATLLRELRELPRVKSDSSWDRANSVPLWQYWGLPAPPCGRSWSWGLGSSFKPSSLPRAWGRPLGPAGAPGRLLAKGGYLKIQLPPAEASSTLWRMPGWPLQKELGVDRAGKRGGRLEWPWQEETTPELHDGHESESPVPLGWSWGFPQQPWSPPASPPSPHHLPNP